MGVPVPVIAPYGIEGADWLVLGRLYVEDVDTHNLNPAVPADVQSITRTLVSLADGVTVVDGPTSLDVNSTILPAISHGNIWTTDQYGFNVRDQIPGSDFETLPGVEVRYDFTLVGGTVIGLHIVIDLKPD